MKEISPSSIHDAISCFFPLLPGARWVQPCKENVAGRLFWGLLSTQVCSSGWCHSLSLRSFPSCAGVWLGCSGIAEGEVGSSTWNCSGKAKGAMWKAAGELLVVAQWAMATETSLRLPAPSGQSLALSVAEHFERKVTNFKQTKIRFSPGCGQV